MTEDVLQSVSLPGWSIFDALFLDSSNDVYGDTDGGPLHTPVTRIQRNKRRAVLVLTILLAFGTFLQYFGGTTPSGTYINSKSSSKTGDTWSFRKASLTTHRRPRKSPAAVVTKQRVPEQRLALLQEIVEGRTSSFKASDFIASSSSAYSWQQGFSTAPTSSTSPPTYADNLVTAVIVNTPDCYLDNVQLIIQLVSKYPFVREIIVWNNDQSVYISQQNLHVPISSKLGFTAPSLRILNSPTTFKSQDPLQPETSNLNTSPPSHAKHLACNLATNPICLFLSPSLLPIHLDSLYTAYISSGALPSSSASSTEAVGATAKPDTQHNQIVASVNAEDFYRLQHLVFQNPHIDLHTGALFTSHGLQHQEVLVRRDWSRRFWKQLASIESLDFGLDFVYVGDDTLDVTDILWSLWMNTVPKLLVAPSLLIAEKPQTKTSDDKVDQDETILSALRALYAVLKLQDPYLSPDTFPMSSVVSSDSTIRSPSHDDRAIFITDMTPFGRSAESLPYASLKFQSASRHPSGKKGFLARLLGSKRDETTLNAESPTTAMQKWGFDPFNMLENIRQYEGLWHLPTLSSAKADAQGSEATFPSDISEWKYGSNWYNAVNGRHPTPMTTSLGNTSSLCWTTPTMPLKKNFFGLRLLSPMKVNTITLYGSKILGNIVGAGEEDLTAESWEVYTMTPGRLGAAELWTRRRLVSAPSVQQLSEKSPFWQIRFRLEPISLQEVRPEAFTDKDDLSDESGPEEEMEFKKRAEVKPETQADADADENDIQKIAQGGRIQGIKFVSRDRKGQKVRICGWEVENLRL